MGIEKQAMGALDGRFQTLRNLDGNSLPQAVALLVETKENPDQSRSAWTYDVLRPSFLFCVLEEAQNRTFVTFIEEPIRHSICHRTFSILGNISVIKLARNAATLISTFVLKRKQLYIRYINSFKDV